MWSYWGNQRLRNGGSTAQSHKQQQVSARLRATCEERLMRYRYNSKMVICGVRDYRNERHGTELMQDSS